MFRHVILDVKPGLSAKVFYQMVKGHLKAHSSQPIRFNKLDLTRLVYENIDFPLPQHGTNQEKMELDEDYL